MLNFLPLQYIQMAQFVSLYRLYFWSLQVSIPALKKTTSDNYMLFKSSPFLSNKSNVSNCSKILFSLLFPFFIQAFIFFRFSLYLSPPKTTYMRNVYHRYSVGFKNVNLRSCSVGIDVSFLRGKPPGCKTTHKCTAEVKNKWTCKSTPPYALMKQTLTNLNLAFV